MPGTVLSPGDTLSDLVVEGILGTGGMSIVYKVRDPRTKMPYAAKVLDPHLMCERDFVKRFKTEAKTAAKLTHMNIVHALKLSGWEGTLYYIMELVEGGPLDETLTTQGAFPMERALVIVRDVAAGLEYAHSMRYVHRDVKPGNILVRPDDHVKLIDFGLAQKFGRVIRTRSGHVMGTAKYMAPELIEGTEAWPQTDIYALGCLTYELLAGRPPFDGDDADLLMDMHLYSRHRPLTEVVKGADWNLSHLIDRMLAKDMSQRVSSAQAIHGWLDFYAANGWFANVPKGF